MISAFAIVARAQYDDEIQIPIPQWHMTQMTQDRQGMIWFATWNGLCRYDGYDFCLLCTSDAADDMQCVDLGGRRINTKERHVSR